jgi:hypothetical protein
MVMTLKPVIDKQNGHSDIVGRDQICDYLMASQANLQQELSDTFGSQVTSSVWVHDPSTAK